MGSDRAVDVSAACWRRCWVRGPAAEPVGIMEPRKPYDIANVLAAIAVLFFLAAAAVLFYWLSHGTAPPSLQGPPSATVR